MRKWILLLVVLLVAAPAAAQAPINWTLRTYLAGAGAPVVAPAVLLVANVVCNQAAPPVTPAINPTKAIWDDSANVGKVCIWTDPGTGPLASVPFGGNYDATLTVTNSAGTSPESARAPFTHPGLVLPVPTGLKVAS